MKIKMSKYFWLGLGFVSLALGTVGIFIPILPTFPFYMLTLFCFTKGSDRLHDWFVATDLYKDNIEKILNRKEISLKSKVSLIAGFSLTMGIGFYFMKNTRLGRIILAIVWFFHMVYFIFGIKTKK